ncbi:MAG: ATP-dependent DNA helicase RecG [bacterium]
MYSLSTPVKNISKIGQATAGRLKKLGIETAEDLIFYFPFRYDNFSEVLSISHLKPGLTASVQGRIDLINNRRSPVKRKIITEAMITDNTGTIKAVWFNQPFLTKTLRIGDYVSLAGKVDYDYYGIQMTSPSYEKLGYARETIHTGRLVPIYSVTENLTQKQIRTLINIVVDLADKMGEFLPDNIIKKYNFLPVSKALREIHFPTDENILAEAKRRLKFDELFLIQLQSQILKHNLKNKKSSALGFKKESIVSFVESLPFKLTEAQRKAAWEIFKDIEQTRPMNRLLEGDVGSGKTIVAAMAMYNTALNNYQAVMMAPTEILARQHFESLSRLMNNFSVQTVLLTRTERKLGGIMNKELRIMNKTEREILEIDNCLSTQAGKLETAKDEIINNVQNENNPNTSKNLTKPKVLELIKNGEANIIIGTHALLQEKVEFKNLGLAIIDEQHRFGVEQRKILREKSGDKTIMPHFLSMTATPIPRSLALTIYGDLDLSILNEMPAGRKKIITKVVAAENRQKAYDFIRNQIKDGRQTFVICPLIDPSDNFGFKSVTEEYKKLNDVIFKELSIGMLHGKLKSAEKDEVMGKFAKNEIQILVSTSVVEVGVDIPNATVMIIEGADHFGLAQLHQFRGRVGRSDFQSYCFLFSESTGQNSYERLSALEQSNNGFALAEKDLQFRGPGQVYGVRQSGIPELKIANMGDYDIIKLAKNEAEKIMEEDPTLSRWAALKEKVDDVIKKVHLE